MFGQRLAGRSAARITRALRTVAAILANPPVHRAAGVESAAH